MRTRVLTALLAFVLCAMGPAASAQEGHPLAGTWYGEYSSGSRTTDLTVIMKWDGKAVSGLIDPGPASSPITSAELTITPGKPAPEGRSSTEGTPPIFHVRFVVNGMTFVGEIRNPVAGNRRIIGTWTRGSEKGAFEIRRL